MLEFLYIKRAGDEEHYARFKAQLENQSDEQLNQFFQNQLKCGIVGVHVQGIYLFCLWKIGRDRNLPFATDPDGGIQVLNGQVISIRPIGKISTEFKH